jgi:hypothetical protein
LSGLNCTTVIRSGTAESSTVPLTEIGLSKGSLGEATKRNLFLPARKNRLNAVLTFYFPEMF